MANQMDLYDELLKKINLKSKTVEDENKTGEPKAWISVINRLPDQLSDGSNPFEIIYALILHHYALEESKTKERSRPNVIPYGGKAFDHGNGVLYTLPNLPPTLLQIIEQYINEIVIL